MKKTIFVLTLALVLLLCGCLTAAKRPGATETVENNAMDQDKEGTAAMESITTWEKELLKTIYTSEMDAERIDKGNLTAYHKNTLEQLRQFSAYLDAKYPGRRFLITGVELPLPDTGIWKYFFTEGAGETIFVASAPSDATTDFADNYYVHLLAPAYDALLLEKLQETGVPVTALRTEFTALLGADGPSELSAEEVLSADVELPRVTAVYLYAEDPAIALETAKPAIQALGAVSGFRVYASPQYVEGLSAEQCAELWRTDRKSAKAVAFTTGA